MARIVPICDTDIGNIVYTNNGQFRCDGPGATVAWIEVQEEDLNVQTLADVTIAEGLQISAAIALVWTVGFIGRTIIRTVLKTRSY